MDIYKQIYIQKLDTSTLECKYLLVYKGQYYEANYSIVELLTCLQKGETLNHGIDLYMRRKNGEFSYKQVEELIARFISPLFIEKETDEKMPITKGPFWYRRELFSSEMIGRFSDFFSVLFREIYMFPFLTLVLLLDGYFFFSTENLLVFNNTTANVYTIIGLFVFVFSSSLFHELGHASACKHFGLNHGGIGFGLYLNFPVLYTNVTEIWCIERKKRCIVNIAGVYFQMHFLLILLFCYWLTNYDIVRYMILIINLGFLMTLNPFFKFDGYWIASDLLGIPNLRSRSKEWLLYVYKRIRKQPVKEKPYLLYTTKIGRYGLLTYSIVVNLFMGYYFFYIIPKFLISFIHSFPSKVHQLILYLSNDITPPFALLRDVVAQLLLLLLISALVLNIVYSFLHAKRK